MDRRRKKRKSSPPNHRAKKLWNILSKISCLFAKTGVSFHSKHHLVFPKEASQAKYTYIDLLEAELAANRIVKVNLPDDQFTALLRKFLTWHYSFATTIALSRWASPSNKGLPCRWVTSRIAPGGHLQSSKLEGKKPMLEVNITATYTPWPVPKSHVYLQGGQGMEFLHRQPLRSDNSGERQALQRKHLSSVGS